MIKKKQKCYIYTRVSTSMQVDGYSLDAQRDKLRKYAEYEDMIVVAEYSDEGFSGKNIQGRHEAIISEADWELAHAKRQKNAYKREKVNDPEHAHILSGILKCPCCGKSLYGNIAKAHSKDNKTRYYYYCKNTVSATGHKCTFRTNIEQTEMNAMVADIISAMTKRPEFIEAIKEKIGSAVDTTDMEKQMEQLRDHLRKAEGTKSRLERQMDELDPDDPNYEKKISDLQRRYDAQYDKINAVEEQIEDLEDQLRTIRQEKISGDNIYQMLMAFDKLYDSFSETEQKRFMQTFIERIDIYPEKPNNGCWIRNIVFNFPMPVQGQEIKALPLESDATVETVALLSKLSEAKHHIEVKVDMDELDLTSAEAKATYEEIREWVQEEYGFNVTRLNIAQVKQKYGIIERENYNKPKSPDSRQPGCPKDKVEAIEDAMRHFQMI